MDVVTYLLYYFGFWVDTNRVYTYHEDHFSVANEITLEYVGKRIICIYYKQHCDCNKISNNSVHICCMQCIASVNQVGTGVGDGLLHTGS